MYRVAVPLMLVVLPMMAVAAEPKVEIIAHRGASHDAPENTLAALRLAWEQKADTSEFDIYQTRDGQLAVIHDKDTKRTAPGSELPVAKSTLAELQKLDVGQWKDARFTGERIPTLADMLAATPRGKAVFIEVKCGPEAVPEMLRVLDVAKLPVIRTPIISFNADVIAAVKKARPELPAYWIVGLKPKKKINTPADMAGIKLRMPGGDAWQFLGQSLGANPTPMAYAEVYTGLQSGAIDGQDNPLPNVQNMKFYEVSSQIVLTSHLVGFDLLCVTKRVWDGMDAKKQAAFQAAADAAIDWSTKEHLAKEVELVDFFKKQGLEVYTPDLKAFRDFAQQKYLASDLAKGWTPGMIEKINAL